jgi:hypothetical protein
MDNNLVTLVSYLNLQAMTFVARYISSEWTLSIAKLFVLFSMLRTLYIWECSKLQHMASFTLGEIKLWM